MVECGDEMDAPETGLMPLGERIQAALEAETQPAEQLRLARIQLLERVTAQQRPPPSAAARWLRFAAFPAIAALLLAAALQSYLRPISFVAGSGKRDVGDVLEAGRYAPLRVEFSEGSRVLLHEGSRARVLGTQASGARVLLESGVADVSIVHRVGRSTRWRFEVGPFQVLVKGTQFELDWQPESQSLSLTMKTGSVELSGACLSAPRLVERGATLRLSCAKATPRRESVVTAPAPSARTAVAGPRASELRSGMLQPAVRDAGAAPRSFEASCETASKTELVTWANRERLTGSLARARTALLVLRRRFASSSEAGTAAFTLGRMAFDQRGDYRDAARWFEAYLSEQPNGALMGDAAGRLLEAHERQGERARARGDAEAYLRRFPDGPYASRARRILSE
jgi:transmembrane sensor